MRQHFIDFTKITIPLITHHVKMEDSIDIVKRVIDTYIKLLRKVNLGMYSNKSTDVVHDRKVIIERATTITSPE